MAEKRDTSSVPSVPSEPRPESELNVAGAARRRLLRTLTASGGAAVGGLLAAKWTEPVIKTAILPAHAQATMIAAACAVNLAVTIAPSGGAEYTVELVARDTNFVTTTLNSAIVPSGFSTVLTGAATYSQGSYSGIFAVSHTAPQDWAFSLSGTCCTSIGGFNSAPGSGVTSFGTGLSIVVIDDGNCTVS